MEGREFAKLHGIDHFYEVSAKSGDNVEPMFSEIVATIVNYRGDNSIGRTMALADNHGVVDLQSTNAESKSRARDTSGCY